MPEIIKPCPFCGKKDILYDEGKPYCNDCFAECDSDEAWNRRAYGTCRDCKYYGKYGDCNNPEVKEMTSESETAHQAMFEPDSDFYCAKFTAKEEK